MRRTISWPLPLAAVWLLIPFFGAIIAAAIEPIPPHDYWWHLAMGRQIAATGAIPDQNLFLYTLEQTMPFVDQPWLGQWLMWEVYHLFGHAGGVWARNGLLALAMACLLVVTYRRSSDARVTGALMLVAVMLAYPVLTVRTRMFAFLPFAASLAICLGVVEHRMGRKWLALLPVITAVWANLHGSFVLGPAVVGAVGVGFVLGEWVEGRRPPSGDVAMWGAAIAATVLAPMLSPSGPGVYSYVFSLAVTSTVASTVTEWLPPNPAEASGALFLGCVIFALVVLAVRRRHVKLYEALLFAGTLYLSATALRGMFWWAATLPVIVAPHLRALLPAADLEAETTTRQGWLHLVAILSALSITLFVQPGVGREYFGELAASGTTRRTGEGAFLLNHQHPVDLVAKIRKDGRGRVFHDQAVGGMLEFVLSDAAEPRQVAYVDQRMEFVPDAVWNRYFQTSSAVGWREELDRWNVDTLLLSHESQWPLLQAALTASDWELVGVDHAHVLLYRRESLDRAQDPAKQ